MGCRVIVETPPPLMDSETVTSSGICFLSAHLAICSRYRIDSHLARHMLLNSKQQCDPVVTLDLLSRGFGDFSSDKGLGPAIGKEAFNRTVAMD